MPSDDGNSQNMIMLPDAILGGFTKPKESQISETSLPPEAEAHASAKPVRRSVTQPYQVPPATAAPPILERHSGRHVRRPAHLKDFV